MVSCRARLAALGLLLGVELASAPAPATGAPAPASERSSVTLPYELGELGDAAIRGITIGPIESGLHPGRGYGSEPFARGLDEAVRLGATWISLTPFGRVWNLQATGVSKTFELDLKSSQRGVAQAIRQAHARGLRVLLVPHLWVESGEWRAEIDPGTDEGWRRFAESYRAYLLVWATLAAAEHADMLAVGVELRSWVTTTRAPSFQPILREVRGVYPGLLTYAANWDDVDQTVILGELDVIGINAFYPLTEQSAASDADLVRGGADVATKIRALAELWQKPVIFNEFGYTARPDPALRPWEWPDHMKSVVVDAAAQAAAYRGLLAGMLTTRELRGAFLWRLYADPDDLSQEAEWGFSPRGRAAELYVRDAFWGRWASDRVAPGRGGLFREPAAVPGIF